MTTLRIAAHQLAGRVHDQAGNEVDRRGDLVPRQDLATAPHDLLLELQRPPVRGVGLGVQHDVGHHEGARDRVFPRSHERHPNAWVGIDDRFDLLRMDFQTADVDDAAPTADEVIAISAALEHVCRVDEPVAVSEGLGLSAEALIKARRQWDGVPEMWVTPCAPARTRKSPVDSSALDSTIDPPPRSARKKICRPPYRRMS